MTIDIAAIGSSVVQVLLVGLLLGAGLPTLFALGIRSLAAADGAVASGRSPRTLKAGAYACFGSTVVVALLGVVVIVFGKVIFGG